MFDIYRQRLLSCIETNKMFQLNVLFCSPGCLISKTSTTTSSSHVVTDVTLLLLLLLWLQAAEATALV